MYIENELLKSSKELKESALEQLNGNWGKAIIVTLISLVIINCVSVSENLNDILNFLKINVNLPFNSESVVIEISEIISFIFSGALCLGSSLFFLKLVRKEEAEVSDILYGFKNFLKAFILELVKSIFIVLWTLLLIVPGIIAALKYSMSYYILVDNPHLSATEAIDLSCKMMNGHKFRLFKLYLSFIGWAVLSILTLGIGFIWLTPYCEATIVNFYEDLKANNTSCLELLN